MELWLIPERENTSYTFDPRRIELEFDNGIRKKPDIIAVSRFKTRLEKERVYAFTPDIIEMVSFREHSPGKQPEEFTGPIELWDWTRLFMRIEKPAREIHPVRMDANGLIRAGTFRNVPTVDFTFKSELRQTLPGTFSDGTWIGHSPDTVCRKLQKKQSKSE